MEPTGRLETSVTTNLLCITSQKIEDLIYTSQKPEITRKSRP